MPNQANRIHISAEEYPERKEATHVLHEYVDGQMLARMQNAKTNQFTPNP